MEWCADLQAVGPLLYVSAPTREEPNRRYSHVVGWVPLKDADLLLNLESAISFERDATAAET